MFNGLFLQATGCISCRYVIELVGRLARARCNSSGIVLLLGTEKRAANVDIPTFDGQR